MRFGCGLPRIPLIFGFGTKGNDRWIHHYFVRYIHGVSILSWRETRRPKMPCGSGAGQPEQSNRPPGGDEWGGVRGSTVAT